MTQVAGSVCKGLLPHPFTTAQYLRERTLRAVERSLAESGLGLYAPYEQQPDVEARHRLPVGIVKGVACDRH